ncbi:hypothetical protein KIN20_016624 [Parelaphostrongylus tenuis]|uniref:Uncharacterized protein n=1 Tax=Parelaphostrongylus tenuis TaxID=148309 RepID=A0AAD5N5F3_PARTN|nr:hypothetical protein KIN20_016624 [Parelaphostrongylus tenuis]
MNKVDRPIEDVLGPKRRFQALTMSLSRNTFLAADPSGLFQIMRRTQNPLRT